MAHATRWGAGVVITVTVAAALSAMRADAVPRYSARYEQNCMLCHVNPTGGGMRSAYAVRELIPKEFAMSAETPEALKAIDPMIGKHMSIGTDLRQLFLAETASNPLAPPQGFFPMQGDVYLCFQLDPKFELYYDRGFTGQYEAFATGHVLPWDGYVKAGRFVPPYGWKFDDHTMYVRDDLGLAPPANSDGGVEVGFSPRPAEVQVAVVNGARGSLLDTDRRLAVSGTASVRFRAGPLSACAGVSGYAHPGVDEDFNTAGAFGYLTGWNVTWVGEGDLIRRDPASAAATSGVVSSHELSVLLRRGVELLATYDFFDPDRRLRSGSRDRWGVGLSVMPRSFLIAQASFRQTRVQQGPAIGGSDFDEGLFQIHVLY